VKAIIFDLGHTLIDYYHEWRGPEAKAVRQTYDILSRSGAAVGDEEEFFSHLSGLLAEARARKLAEMVEVPLSSILSRCFARYGWNGGDEVMDRSLRAFYGTLLETRELIPGSVEMLEKVRERGLAIGLISDVAWGLPSEFPMKDMRHFGLEAYFDDLIFSTDVGLRKPNPRVFKLALANLDAGPREAMYIGNSLQADIRGALGVGMLAVLKKSKFYQHDDSIVPDERISDWSELDAVIEKHVDR